MWRDEWRCAKKIKRIWFLLSSSILFGIQLYLLNSILYSSGLSLVIIVHFLLTSQPILQNKSMWTCASVFVVGRMTIVPLLLCDQMNTLTDKDPKQPNAFKYETIIPIKKNICKRSINQMAVKTVWTVVLVNHSFSKEFCTEIYLYTSMIQWLRIELCISMRQRKMERWFECVCVCVYIPINPKQFKIF